MPQGDGTGPAGGGRGGWGWLGRRARWTVCLSEMWGEGDASARSPLLGDDVPPMRHRDATVGALAICGAARATARRTVTLAGETAAVLRRYE
jgi:hypothetical protein